LDAFFAEEYISTDQDVEVRFGTRPENYLRKVASFIHRHKSGGRILDLGCAGGHFLDRFFPAPAWEKWGVDLSKFAAARARAKGIRVPSGDITSAILPRGEFDVVTVLDTFFYFLEPWRELEAVRRALKPDGLLVITAPSAAVHIWRNRGWRAKLFRQSQSPLLQTHHLFFYNPRTMASLLGRSQFRMVAVRPLPATAQGSLLRNAAAGGYFAASLAAWELSRFRIMLAPRFMVAAVPCS